MTQQAPSAAAAAAMAIDAMAQQFEGSGCQSGCPVTAIAFEMSSSSEPLRRATQAAYEGRAAQISARLVDDGAAPEAAQVTARALLGAIEGPPPQSPPRVWPEPAVTQASEALAEALGGFAVQCDLPSVPPPLSLRPNSYIEGNTLYMVAEEPQGDLALVDEAFRDPWAFVVWMGDEGHSGDCIVTEAVVHSASGHVVGDGPLPEEVWCGTRPFPVDDDGGFEVHTTRQVCLLHIRMEGYIGSKVVDLPADEPLTVELIPDRPRPDAGLAQLFLDMAAEQEEEGRSQGMVDPYEVALEHPDLPDDARAVLKAWQTASDDIHNRRVEANRHMGEAFLERSEKDDDDP